MHVKHGIDRGRTQSNPLVGFGSIKSGLGFDNGPFLVPRDWLEADLLLQNAGTGIGDPVAVDKLVSNQTVDLLVVFLDVGTDLRR